MKFEKSLIIFLWISLGIAFLLMSMFVSWILAMFFIFPLVILFFLVLVAKYIEFKIRSKHLTYAGPNDFWEYLSYQRPPNKKSLVDASKADKIALIILLIFVAGTVAIAGTTYVFSTLYPSGSAESSVARSIDNPYIWATAASFFFGTIFGVYGIFKLLAHEIKKKKQESIIDEVISTIILGFLSVIFLINWIQTDFAPISNLGHGHYYSVSILTVFTLLSFVIGKLIIHINKKYHKSRLSSLD